jgi:hypothetical protein
MAIKTIPLSRLEADLQETLNECAQSGETIVVEMPDQRLLAIQSLDPHEEDTLVDKLLSSNPKFQALVDEWPRSLPPKRREFARPFRNECSRR